MADTREGGVKEPSIAQLKALAGFALAHAVKQKNDGMEALALDTEKWLNDLGSLTSHGIVELAEEVLKDQGEKPCPMLRVLELSTAHISPETGGLLGHNPCSNQRIDDSTYGWWVHVHHDDVVEGEFGYPDDLKHVLAIARGKGCQWLRLDEDADVVDDIPTFDW
jgi:hypothetical protein